MHNPFPVEWSSPGEVFPFISGFFIPSLSALIPSFSESTASSPLFPMAFLAHYHTFRSIHVIFITRMNKPPNIPIPSLAVGISWVTDATTCLCSSLLCHVTLPSKHGQDPWRPDDVLIWPKIWRPDLAQNITWFEPGRCKRTSQWCPFDDALEITSWSSPYGLWSGLVLNVTRGRHFSCRVLLNICVT